MKKFIKTVVILIVLFIVGYVLYIKTDLIDPLVDKIIGIAFELETEKFENKEFENKEEISIVIDNIEYNEDVSEVNVGIGEED